ncbi:ATP-binding protein [Spirillospora sp. NPDC029432]|uniref:ATP-binding protein n=1 Tax=Spirillospora sp. NPDC029432 TaxID=3154599 RepID=UPI0034515D4C
MRGRVRVDGDVSGQMVVGDRNVVINANGSTVSVGAGKAPRIRSRRRPAHADALEPDGRLVGRERELAEVTARLRQGRPVVVHGAPGAGRSAFVRQVAAAWDTDVVLVAGAGQAPQDVQQRLFELCYDVEDYRPAPGRLRGLMESIQALIVVDDFSGSDKDLAALADTVRAGRLLVSMAGPVQDGRAWPLELGGLTEEHALALVTARLGRELDESEIDAVCCVYEACGGHPGTMVQAAAAIEAGRGEALGTDPAVLRDALVAGLDAPARAALEVLRALPGVPVDPELLRALGGGSADAAELERLGLAVPGAGGHMLAAGLETGADPAGYAEALIEWARTAPPRRTAAAGPVVLAVLGATARRGDDENACRLARATAPAFNRALRWGTWRRVLRVGLECARRIGSAADVEYFEHEDRARRCALGMLAGLAAGTAAGGAALAVHGAAATGAKASGAAALAQPGIVVAVATALVAAGIAGLVAMRGQERPASAPAPAPAPSSAPSARLPEPTTASPARTSRSPEPQGPARVVARPSTVGPGDMLTVTATGFAPRRPLNFEGLAALDGGSEGIRRATTDDRGRAEMAVKVHAPPAGRYRVHVYDVLTHLTPGTWVEVEGPGRGTGREGVESTPPPEPLEILVRPLTPVAGQEFMVIASGFQGEEPVRIQGPEFDITATADDSGLVRAVVRAPSDAGTYRLTATGARSGRFVGRELLVKSES